MFYVYVYMFLYMCLYTYINDPKTLNPQPWTSRPEDPQPLQPLNPKPYTLYTLYTLNPKPYTVFRNLKLQALNRQGCISCATWVCGVCFELNEE